MQTSVDQTAPFPVTLEIEPISKFHVKFSNWNRWLMQFVFS